MNLRPATAAIRPSVRGASLVELMVGLTVGLLVLTGATAWAGHTLGQQQRQLKEWQMHQELRALAAQLQLELRRAGAHGQPSRLVWRPDGPAQANDLASLDVQDGGHTIRFSRATGDARSDTASASAFRWLDARLDQSLGGRFQPLTDPQLISITGFSAALQTRHHAGSGCGSSVQRRTVLLDLQAQIPGDDILQQDMALAVHVRNDAVGGGCR